jgi:hypothetical protein
MGGVAPALVGGRDFWGYEGLPQRINPFADCLREQVLLLAAFKRCSRVDGVAPTALPP